MNLENKDKQYYVEKIKDLLDIEDTEIYDSKIILLLGGAVSTLKTAGIPQIKKDEEFSDSYAICLAMEVSKFLDIEFDHDNLQRQYITAVNTLRLEFL